MAAPAIAALDLSGNGASEIWQLTYPSIRADEEDADNDGVSNYFEMIAGTNPLDSESALHLNFEDLLPNQWLLTWDGVFGKKYVVETFDVSQSVWTPIHEVTLGAESEEMEYAVSEIEDEDSGIFRLRVSDVDEDGDGLTAWEESLLGLDDSEISSVEEDDFGDYHTALAFLEQESGVTLTNGVVLPQRLPTVEEASRFLVQTSFGPTSETINEVMAMGLNNYFDSQVAKSSSLTSSGMFSSGAPVNALLWRSGWWRGALIGEDQLRQRIAYALSQVFVVNIGTGTVIGDNPLVQAAYYDPLITGCFGSYRALLDHVTYSPTMGFYLSHLKNRKSDASLNRFPDENFAREIMQLFTIGLWELNSDGSRKVDDVGEYIPTYDNDVITEVAKIFTGMSHTRVNNGQIATSFFDAPRGNDYRFPMRVWDEEHEPGSKLLFNGVIIPEGQTGEEDVQQTLDALCDHPNIGPFVSRLLIQRFTSSNPSPSYLERVSHIWQQSDGNLEAVMKAILFDPEARTPDLKNGKRGKLREPLIRMTQIMRAFGPQIRTGNFTVSSGHILSETGQFPLLAPSVFNFYLPDHQPTGLLTEEDLVAPEFQIATTNSLLTTHNLLRVTADTGHREQDEDYTEELIMLSDPQILVDHLDQLLTYGTMNMETRSAVLDQISREVSDSNKVRIAVQLIVTSPEFSVLK